MKGKLLVSCVSIYGRTTFYPKNAEARLFAEIEATKTITPRCMAIAKALGYEIEVGGKAAELEEALSRIEFGPMVERCVNG